MGATSARRCHLKWPRGMAICFREGGRRARTRLRTGGEVCVMWRTVFGLCAGTCTGPGERTLVMLLVYSR